MRSLNAKAGGSASLRFRIPRIRDTIFAAIIVRTISVTRYVTPLREGGSLPALVEADDDGLYVLKFRGAGQGAKALIAELVSGEIARTVGLRVPEIVFATLNPDLARTEPDPEIHALIHDSAGLNLAVDFLPGASTFDPVVERPDPDLASRIVWFDAYVTNVDRTARNTNLLMWHRTLWLIDHGATLYLHHSPGWHEDAARARAPFATIREHVLLRHASALAAVDDAMAASLGGAALEAIVGMVPEEWLAADPGGVAPAVARAAYVRYLRDRLAAPRAFVEEAARVR
jgi:HipA-like protein